MARYPKKEQPKEPASSPIVPVVLEVETAKSMCMRYHETEQPRIFQTDEVIPEGWNLDNRRFWSCNMLGKWTRRK